MNSGKAEDFLDDAGTCALYLTDALETGRPTTVGRVLREIGRRNGAKVRSLGEDSGMQLTEIMDILESAGLQLIALPAKSDENGPTEKPAQDVRTLQDDR